MGFAIILNLKSVLGIGRYDIKRDFTIDLDGNNAGLTVEIDVKHFSESYHDYALTITAFSTGDIYVEGISYLFYKLFTSSSTKQLVDMNYSTPINPYSISQRTRLYQNDNLTCEGFTDVIFNVNSVNEIHRIYINLGLIIELDGELINYEWGNIATWINVIYLTLTVIPLTLFLRSVKRLKFERWYTEEMKERDEKFFEILSKNENVQSKE